MCFDGRLVYAWYGENSDERDCFAARDGVVLTFLSETAVRDWASAAGLPADEGEEVDVIDVGPVQAWLSGRLIALDTTSALELWNLVGDIAYSTGRPWRDRGRLNDSIYDKLFAANVPWMAHLETYRPRWTPRQIRRLRIRDCPQLPEGY